MKARKKVKRAAGKLLKRKTHITARAKGLPKGRARSWAYQVSKDFSKNNGVKSKDKLKAYKEGFLSSSAKKYGIADNYADYIPDVNFDFIKPVNNYFNFWLSDRLIQRVILQKYADLFAPVLYSIIFRDGKKALINWETKKTETPEEMYETLKKTGPAVLCPTVGNRRSFFVIEFHDDKMFINDEEVPAEEFGAFLADRSGNYIIRSKVDAADGLCQALECLDSAYRFTTVTDAEDNTRIMACDLVVTKKPFQGLRPRDIKYNVDLETGKILCDHELKHSDYCSVPWKDLCDKVTEVANYISEDEFISIYVRPTNDGFVIDQLTRVTTLPSSAKKGTPLYDYINELYDYKWNKYKNGEIKMTYTFKYKLLRRYTKRHLKKGIRPYMAGLWLNTVKDDFLHTKKPLKDKIWAWKRGFPSFRIDQYHLTEDNWKDVLSDFDYAWLNRINNNYRLLIDDKLSLRYSLEPFKEYLPAYYYLILKRRDQRMLKKLMDLPEGYPRSNEGILKLLRDKGKLVFKPVNGTHGDGFYKLEYVDNNYVVNGKTVTAEELLTDTLYAQKSIYTITEYVEMHHQLKEIYPVSVNTIRVLVLNRTCDNPVIEHAYMRIGSSKTGFTDNIGYGGICCYMDKDTGRYYGGQMLMDHKFTPCPVHPDTGTTLEGYVPHWDKVCNGILDICRYIPQVEYIGFDIAITEDGFTIIELNIHQDLHRFVEYPDSVKQFFKDKIKEKEIAYGLRKREILDDIEEELEDAADLEDSDDSGDSEDSNSKRNDDSDVGNADVL